MTSSSSRPVRSRKPGQEAVDVACHEVGRHRAGVGVVVAEVLPGVADAGELPVDEVPCAVGGDQHVGGLEVAVHEAERRRRRPVGVHPRHEVADDRQRLDVVVGDRPPGGQLGVDVGVPVAGPGDAGELARASTEATSAMRSQSRSVARGTVAARLELGLERGRGEVVEEQGLGAEPRRVVDVPAGRRHRQARRPSVRLCSSAHSASRSESRVACSGGGSPRSTSTSEPPSVPGRPSTRAITRLKPPVISS